MRDRRLDDMTRTIAAAGYQPIEVEMPTSHGERPGSFVATDPPIGSPLPAGSTVRVEYAAGDLSSYAQPRSLRSAGWQVFPAEGPLSATVSRDEAKRSVLGDDLNWQDFFNADAFLRRVSLRAPSPGSSAVTPDITDRLVWVVVKALHYNGRGNTSTLTLVDATTGDVLASGSFDGTS